MPKPTPKQIWQDLVDEAGEAEVDRAAAVTVEQAEQDLADAGFDVPAERARAEAFLDELAGEAERVKGLTGGEVDAELVANGADLAKLRARAQALPAKRAAQLRTEAFAACDARRWGECKEKLDEAQQLDPAGESDPRVALAREAAEKGG